MSGLFCVVTYLKNTLGMHFCDDMVRITKVFDIRSLVQPPKYIHMCIHIHKQIFKFGMFTECYCFTDKIAV